MAPTVRDSIELPCGGKLGTFWTHCKSMRRCEKPPYDRLMTNPILRVDYRTSQRHERAIAKSKISAGPEMKVQVVRIQMLLTIMMAVMIGILEKKLMLE